MAKRVSSLGHRHTANDLTPFLEGSATISGDWTFSGSIDFTKSAVAGQYGSTINIYSGNPQISIEDTGAATNEGVWNIIGGTGNLKIRALSDDFSTAVDAISIERGTGATVDDVKLTLGATGALEITGTSYKTNPTGMRLGQYDTTTGYLQVPGNGKIDIWNGGTGVIARFHETSKQCAFYGPVSIPDGITAPSTVSGRAFIYVDTSDGDLKVKFGDGTTKTIATDT